MSFIGKTVIGGSDLMSIEVQHLQRVGDDWHDEAELAQRALNRQLTPARRRKKDWHKKWKPDEPICKANQWRTRDRNEVINISAMDDTHLRHAYDYAIRLSQHASRLGALTRERVSRKQLG